MKSILVTSGFVSMLAASTSQACDLCSIYSASQARGDLGKGIYAGVAEQFTHYGTIQVEGSEIPNEAHQHMDSSISQVFAGYNFGEMFGLQLNVPLVARWYQRPAEDGGIERGSLGGLGDMALIAHFQPIRRETPDATLAWTILAGVKFPTGDSGRISEEVAELTAPPPAEGAVESGIHGHDLALGSGSFDGIVGTGIYARWKRAFLNASMQYAIRSKGDFDYRYANDLTWFGGPGVYLLLKDKYTLSLQAVVSGEHKGTDRFRGHEAEDTGVTMVYAGPQVAVSWKENLSAEAGLDIPVIRDNTALQIVSDWRVRAGVTWHF
ncbi:MAG TPA: hypothetical protein VMZ27_13225 [Candidatus Saccharimonadales bacterium]|nr:hypothetical protein [Candidatus Saccharimonadales bacterium]